MALPGAGHPQERQNRLTDRTSPRRRGVSPLHGRRPMTSASVRRRASFPLRPDASTFPQARACLLQALAGPVRHRPGGTLCLRNGRYERRRTRRTPIPQFSFVKARRGGDEGRGGKGDPTRARRGVTLPPTINRAKRQQALERFAFKKDERPVGAVPPGLS